MIAQLDKKGRGKEQPCHRIHRYSQVSGTTSNFDMRTTSHRADPKCLFGVTFTRAIVMLGGDDDRARFLPNI
jgi:hypothetical protein